MTCADQLVQISLGLITVAAVVAIFGFVLAGVLYFAKKLKL